MTVRPRIVAVGLAFLLVAAALVGAGAPADLEELDATGDDALTPGMDSLGDDVIRYGDGTPGFAVKVESANDTDALEDWANSSANYDLQSTSGNWSVVSAPVAAVTGGFVWTERTILGQSISLPGWAGDGLAAKSYVVAVEPQRSMGVDPVESIRSEEQYERPEGAGYVAATKLGVSGSDFSASGLAFDEDANLTTIQEDRAATGSTDVASTGSGITVAVVDTGANTKDGELFGNGSTGSTIRIDNASKSFVGEDSETVDSAGDYSVIADGNGHGTHVASTIAANTTDSAYDGYAPDATLLVLKALDDEGSGTSSDIAAAIRYAADENADILSLSLGSQTYSQQIAEAVAYAEDEGTIVVIASGNSRPLFVASPGDTPGPTITVGAANHPANVTDARPASFSQGGPDNGQDLSDGVTAGQNITVVAPGMKSEAMVATEGGVLDERALSGTSMATPQVAGGIAQLLASEPDLKGNASKVKARLTSTARRLPNAAAADVGSGYLAVDRMVANETAVETQAEAMTADAEARDAALLAYSDASGGFVFKRVTGTSSWLSGLTDEAN